MRALAALLVVIVSAACSKAEQAGAEQARLQAEREARTRAARVEPARKITPPVPNSGRIPCATLIDLARWQDGLGEKEPLSIRDQTRGEPDAAASCGLVRGGKPLTEAEQAALIKKEGRLGVLPEDVLCDVTAFCWTIEDADRFRNKCAASKQRDDETMGSYACVKTTATGPFDIDIYQFFDEDTRCILRVRGGPSQTDNDLIRTCAKIARDSIGPAQIVAGPAAPAPAAAGSGSSS